MRILQIQIIKIFTHNVSVVYQILKYRPGALNDLQGRGLRGGELFIEEHGDLLYKKYPVNEAADHWGVHYTTPRPLRKIREENGYFNLAL